MEQMMRDCRKKKGTFEERRGLQREERSKIDNEEGGTEGIVETVI
jgi:hypothetical protein